MFEIHPFLRARRLLRLTGLAVAAWASSGVSAQTFPLSENSWQNPEFVERFLGSYGALTELEPQISSAEATLFQNLATQLEAGNPEQAIQMLRQALQPVSSAAVDYTLGNLLLQNGQIEPAMQVYRSAIRKHPRFLRAYKNLGLALIQSGSYEDARDMLIKALELGDKEGNTFGLLAYCYLNLNEWARARDTYSLARVLSPGNRDWVVGYAQSLMQTGEYRKAIPVFEELIAQQPGLESYYTVIANAYISLEEYPTASRYLEVIHRMGRADATALGLLGDIYMNEELFDLALHAYLDAYEVRGEVSNERSLRIAGAFVNRAAYPQAERFIEAFRSRQPVAQEIQGDLLNLEASIALARGASEEAAGILERLVEEDPRNGRALILLGDYYAAAGGDAVKASYYYSVAQNIQETQVEARIQHARLKVRERAYEEAIELLEAAQALRYQNNVARYLEAVRRVAEAST